MQEVEPFLAKNGGPVIMGQIENELGSYGGAASQECVAWLPSLNLCNTLSRYADWCGDFVQSLQAQIPWVMCNGLSAPSTVNTCNSNDCEKYVAPLAQRVFVTLAAGTTATVTAFCTWTSPWRGPKTSRQEPLKEHEIFVLNSSSGLSRGVRCTIRSPSQANP